MAKQALLAQAASKLQEAYRIASCLCDSTLTWSTATASHARMHMLAAQPDLPRAQYPRMGSALQLCEFHYSPSASAEQGTLPITAATREPHTKLFLDKTSDLLAQGDVASYYQLRQHLIPEATRSFHQAFYPARPPGKERKGGCKGLQEEVEAAGRPAVMYRRCLHELQQRLEAQGPPARLLLQGPTGSGKSVALAALVEWARAKGWLAMYVPSASTLTAGGYFIKRPSTGLYDTPIAAQHILKGVHDVHKKELESLPRMLGGRQGTLADLALTGLTTDNAAQAVDACLGLRDELVHLSATRPVLFAVDDYNALFWTTDYGTHPPKGRRQLLRVEDLTLASGMRLVSGGAELGKARVVCAVTWSRAMSPKVQIPLEGAEEYHVPRYSEVEVAHAMAYYHEAGVAPSMPTESLLLKMAALTNGNAAELRRIVPRATALEMGLL